MVIELVVGMLLGLAIGFGLDALFGTRPVFLVVFALLGFAAGVRTMLRTAEEVRRGRGEAALMRDRTDGPGPGRGREGDRWKTEAEGGSGFNIHPMDQFEVHPLFGGTEVHWYTPTNATLWMALTVIGVSLLMIGGARGRALVPSRAQSMAEVDLRLRPQDDRGRRRQGRR